MKVCNRLHIICNQLPETLTNAIIDYQRGFSRNVANSHILSFGFWIAIKGLYICVTWDEIGKEFYLFKMSYPLKRKLERYSKRTSLPNALSKETLGQTLAHPLRVSPWTSIVISFSSRENSSFFLLIQRDCLRDRGSLKL